MAVYRFGPGEEADLREIGAFTLRHWGELQLERLLSTLHEKLKRYAERPALGRVREEHSGACGKNCIPACAASCMRNSWSSI